MDICIEWQLMVTTEEDGGVVLHAVESVTDPAIAHLVQLLLVELRSPQPMSQLVISSIITVLLTHTSGIWAQPTDPVARNFSAYSGVPTSR